jgi:cytochrome c biogenesis protein CcmG/thiol:disulfide interchange protein DsbE
MPKRTKLYPVQIPPLPIRPSRSGMSRKVRAKLGIGLAAVIAAIVVTAIAAAVFHHKQKLLPAGADAPVFSLRSASGSVISLASLHGKPALLAFCATWSSDCAVETSDLNAVYAQRLGLVVGVNSDSETPASVVSFIGDHHVRYPVLLDQGSKVVTFPPRGPRGPVTARFHVTELPTYYVLDAAGHVAWTATGRRPAAVLAEELRKAARPLP